MKYIKTGIFIILIFSFYACNMGRQYANYRFGGRNEIENEKESAISNEQLNDYSLSNEPKLKNEFIFTSIKDSTEVVELSQNERNDLIFSFDSGSAVQHLDNTIESDSIPIQFEMEEELAQAYASPVVNILAAISGLLVTVNANFAWIGIVFYIAVPIAALIGIICFSIVLNKLVKNRIDSRNEKYLWLWVLAFLVTLILAIMVLMITL